MESFIKKLLALQELINSLSWQKIFQLAVFLVIILSAWSIYETKGNILSQITPTGRQVKTLKSVKQISKGTMEIISNEVNKSELIVGVQISVVDFQKNTRGTVYMYIDDVNFQSIYNTYVAKGLNELPVFNDDVLSNKQMVGLINGEFICSPFIETMGYKVLSDANKYVQTVCVAGIPPYYGKFVGTVSVYTKRTPAPEDVDRIRGFAKKLATTIYETDFR